MSESTPEVPVEGTTPVVDPTPTADVSTVEGDVNEAKADVEADISADAPQVEKDVADAETDADDAAKTWALAKGILQGLGHPAVEAERALVQLFNSGLKLVHHDEPAKSASDVFPTAVPPVS